MAFSKAVLLVVFAVLLISAEVSALRDLAETKTTSASRTINRGVIGGHTGNGGPVSGRRPEKCNNPYSRECHMYENGGKGGNGEKRGRGAPGPEIGN